MDKQVKLLKKLCYCPLRIQTLKTCNQATCITKITTARSFKFGQLKEDDE